MHLSPLTIQHIQPESTAIITPVMVSRLGTSPKIQIPNRAAVVSRYCNGARTPTGARQMPGQKQMRNGRACPNPYQKYPFKDEGCFSLNISTDPSCITIMTGNNRSEATIEVKIWIVTGEPVCVIRRVSNKKKAKHSAVPTGRGWPAYLLILWLDNQQRPQNPMIQAIICRQPIGSSRNSAPRKVRKNGSIKKIASASASGR